MSKQREQYLALRREGKTHEEACTAIGLSTVRETARRYARWWQHESGEAPPVYPAVNPWRGK